MPRTPTPQAYGGVMMDKQRGLLAQLREQAEARAKHLAAELGELVSARRGESDDDEHDPDGVTLSSEWSRLSALLEAARADAAQAANAIQNYDAGTYGVCANCGIQIPAGRLEARPFADRCVDCAE